jgi:hypothetical protein
MRVIKLTQAPFLHDQKLSKSSEFQPHYRYRWAMHLHVPCFRQELCSAGVEIVRGKQIVELLVQTPQALSPLVRYLM